MPVGWDRQVAEELGRGSRHALLGKPWPAIARHCAARKWLHTGAESDCPAWPALAQENIDAVARQKQPDAELSLA